jgi:hypothetical protein
MEALGRGDDGPCTVWRDWSGVLLYDDAGSRFIIALYSLYPYTCPSIGLYRWDLHLFRSYLPSQLSSVLNWS